MQIEQRITELQIKLSELKDGLDWLATAPCCDNALVADSVANLKAAVFRIEKNLGALKVQLR